MITQLTSQTEFLRKLLPAGLKACWLAVLGILATGSGSSLMAGSFQAASVLNSTAGAPAGGGGDSLAPVISPDGRYVLFASAAGNLLLNTNNSPIPTVSPAKLNLFLRDRM